MKYIVVHNLSISQKVERTSKTIFHCIDDELYIFLNAFLHKKEYMTKKEKKISRIYI